MKGEGTVQKGPKLASEVFIYLQRVANIMPDF